MRKKKRKKKKKKIRVRRVVMISTTKTKTMSQLTQEARKEILLASSRETLYPLMPSKKDKEHYFKRFLTIFQKIEITIPFGEAIQ